MPRRMPVATESVAGRPRSRTQRAQRRSRESTERGQSCQAEARRIRAATEAGRPTRESLSPLLLCALSASPLRPLRPASAPGPRCVPTLASRVLPPFAHPSTLPTRSGNLSQDDPGAGRRGEAERAQRGARVVRPKRGPFGLRPKPAVLPENRSPCFSSAFSLCFCSAPSASRFCPRPALRPDLCEQSPTVLRAPFQRARGPRRSAGRCARRHGSPRC